MEEGKRVSPISTVDKELLREIIKPHLQVVESKSSGMTMVHQKNRAWWDVMTQFNASATSGQRTLKQLKKCWENMKTVAKKATAINKRERYRTGGGSLPKDATVSDELEQELDMVGTFINPLANPFDDDASINGDKEPNEVVDLDVTPSSSQNPPPQTPAPTPNHGQREQFISARPSVKTRANSQQQLLAMEEEEHDLRMEYWRLKIQFLKEKHATKMAKLKAK